MSVVIPTRNRRATLPLAVDSVLSQQGVEVEVIVVDDGSTDGTADDVRRLVADDARVTLIEQPGMGAAHARNVGVSKARFTLIAFNDSDDIWLPGKLANQCDFMAAHGFELVAGRYRFIDADGAVTMHPDGSETNGPTVTRRQLLRTNWAATQTLLIKRSLFDQIGGFDERLFRFQDWDLALRASFVADMGLFPGVVAEVSGTGSRISDNAEAALAASQLMSETLIRLGCSRADVAPLFSVVGWNCKESGNDTLAVEAYALALRHRFGVGVALRYLRSSAKSRWPRSR